MPSKRIILAIGATILLLAGLTPGVVASPRGGELRGELHVTKECGEYHGLAGEFCTFQSSNIKAIGRGDRIVYVRAAGPDSLDTDVVIVAGRRNVAVGHCSLVFASLPGRCTFWGGTGEFTDFHASVSVSVDDDGLWHWDGTYSFMPQG